MQLYSHLVTLRIGHPTLDPETISRTLGFRPDRSWRAGDPRQTPKGTPLGGVRGNRCWSADPFGYGWRASADGLIEDTLDEVLRALEPHRDFLLHVGQEGRVGVWVSSSGERNYSMDLSPAMLGRLASLGVALVHDVYQGS